MLRIYQILGGGGCFDEYGVTFDSIPYSAEAEYIVLHIVTKDWEIIELLIW